MSCKCGGSCANSQVDLWPEYVYTEVIERECLRHVTPLILAAGTSRPIATLSDVRRQAIFSVRLGLIHLWFVPDAGKPYIDGDEPHVIISADAHPFVLDLAPGRHQFIVGAGGGADLAAVITVQDVEGRR